MDEGDERGPRAQGRPGSAEPRLKPGLYEQVISNALHDSVASLPIIAESLDVGESHDVLSEYLQRVVREALKKLQGQDRLQCQVQLCNRLVVELGRIPDTGEDPAGSAVHAAGERLLAVLGDDIGPQEHAQRPDTPLARGCILTGTRLDPSLESQIKKEIMTASRIDILCSFIKWTGIRTLESELRAFTNKRGTRLRVITTSYLGATDLKAIDVLMGLPNTEIRVSYDTRRTRLHAKAYAFYRDSGFGTAYVGSANLSRPALTEGLEWSVKVSQYESPHLWTKATAAFETYWNDREFVPYTPEERPRLIEALASESGDGPEPFSVNFDLRPYPFQQEILDHLEAERSIQERMRHLVVAATGTGKTMIAAFDYRRWASEMGGPKPRLLFVAHRHEILQQSLFTFRAVLRDQNFGDLLVGGAEPRSLSHLFVTIQSYNSKALRERMSPDYYDYVVVDEFHHAAAASYDKLLRHVRPKVLLGLTATPERSDGLDVLRHFDGHLSAEIRLPDAVNRKLLCPFQYFGVTDPVDLSGLSWQRGSYRADELERVYTGNDLRADLIIQKVSEILLDVRQARGLGFCVSVAHANYMAEKFRRAGIPAEALSAETDRQTRHTVQKRLRDKEINFVFTVDLYNEGVDIPEVDAVLFLRPTESLTVFLQQLGRGLRHSEGKDCLTVLDFIGQAHRKYRFDIRYKALIDDPTRSIGQQLEQDFPHLPAGCTVHIERIAKQHILGNIRHSLLGTRTYLVQELSDMIASLDRVPSLGEFLEYYRLEPDDIYRKGISWSRLCAESCAAVTLADPDEERLTKGLRRLQHMCSASQIRALLPLLDQSVALPEPNTVDEATKRLVLMLDLSLWGRDNEHSTVTEGLSRLRANPMHCRELAELLLYKLSRIDSVAPTVELPFPCPLTVHALYTRDEILAGLGHWSLDQRPALREGVLHLQALPSDVVMVTLNKTETDYSPTTMYEDYAISETLFHWQSQSTTSEASPTGRRYIEHAGRRHSILLFVREHKAVNGLSSPYYFLGPVDYVSHSGTRPVSFVWRLRCPMPARLLRKTARLAVD